MSDNKERTKADDLWDAQIKWYGEEVCADDYVYKLFTEDRDGTPYTPFSDWHFDYYDKSVLIETVTPEWKPTQKHLYMLSKYGFEILWTKDTDGNKKAYGLKKYQNG